MIDLNIGDAAKLVPAGDVVYILEDAYDNAATNWEFWLSDQPSWLQDALVGYEYEFAILMNNEDEELIKTLKSYAGAELVRLIDETERGY